MVVFEAVKKPSEAFKRSLFIIRRIILVRRDQGGVRRSAAIKAKDKEGSRVGSPSSPPALTDAVQAEVGGSSGGGAWGDMEKISNAPGLSRSIRYGSSLYSSRTRSQSRSAMVRLASVPRTSITNSSASSWLIWAARSPT